MHGNNIKKLRGFISKLAKCHVSHSTYYVFFFYRIRRGGGGWHWWEGRGGEKRGRKMNMV
jgi:hypothetical protein